MPVPLLGGGPRPRGRAVSKITAWPDGPEDLYVERDRDLIWTTAERPNKRVTLGVPMQGY
ncbi:MAG: hypothetical protein JNL82_06990 [Myxococcales bacterium]|nr:hypothetical protein [Myxococcales bacterium]